MAKKKIHCSRQGYSDPDLRCSIMTKVFRSNKGGNSYQWSARKAQLVSKLYRDAGGKFSSRKTKHQLSLEKWTEQDWTTKSGKPSLETGERYLPRKAIRKLTDKQYRRTTRAKRAGMRKGKQFVRQPTDVSRITKPYRQNSASKGMHSKAKKITDSDYKKILEENNGRNILIWFYATWCGHCQHFAPIYDDIYDEMHTDDDYVILCVDIDESPEMSSEYEITGIPTIYKLEGDTNILYEGARTKDSIIAFLKE
jgi:thiol-disulfide isomerase/thioredoxin